MHYNGGGKIVKNIPLEKEPPRAAEMVDTMEQKNTMIEKSVLMLLSEEASSSRHSTTSVQNIGIYIVATQTFFL